MAVLSKIRQRSLLVIAVVGVALFAFVLMDLIGNGGIGDSGRYVGSINGKDISTEEFRFKVANQQEQNKGASSLMIANSIWGQEIKNTLYEEQFEKLGLRAGEAQIKGVLEQSGQAMFLDQTGKFSQEKFDQYIEMVKIQTPNWRMWLEDYEKQLEAFAKEQTYNTLVKAGINTTGFDGRMAYERESNKVNFDYVVIPYATINDDEVKVTDAEIIEYMSKRKNQFRGDDSRDFEYVLIENKASEADIQEIEERITSLLEPKVIYNEINKQNETIAGFASTENIEEFVNSNSDIPFDEKYIFANNLPALADATVNAVTPLYKEDGYIKMSRILDSKSIADSVKSSHIIIPYQGSMAATPESVSKEMAKKQADSIFDLVKINDTKFREIADQINTDGTKGNGGEIGWVQYSQITYDGFDKDFAEFIFFNSKGDVQVIDTKFGYHIIKIDDTGSKATAYKVATIAQQIEPSNTTSDQTYTFSQQVEVEAQNQSLEDLSKTHNLTVVPVNGITAIEENIAGIGAQRAIVQWAFAKDSKKGEVKRFDVTQGHVIAKIKNINKNGLQSVEKVRASLEPVIRNEKKATIITGKINSGASLEDIAKTHNETVKSTTGLSLQSPLIQGLGQEPKVVGVAMATETGKTSAPIQGNHGIYVIRTQALVKAPELPNYATYSNRIKTQSQNSAQGRIFSSLRNNAEIVDKRIDLMF